MYKETVSCGLNALKWVEIYVTNNCTLAMNSKNIFGEKYCLNTYHHLEENSLRCRIDIHLWSKPLAKNEFVSLDTAIGYMCDGKPNKAPVLHRIWIITSCGISLLADFSRGLRKYIPTRKSGTQDGFPCMDSPRCSQTHEEKRTHCMYTSAGLM